MLTSDIDKIPGLDLVRLPSIGDFKQLSFNKNKKVNNENNN